MGAEREAAAMMLWDFGITGDPWGGWVLMGAATFAVWGLAVAGIVALFHGFGAGHRTTDKPEDRPDTPRV
jgi:hypothetical protein